VAYCNGLTGRQRDEKIAELRKHGYSYAKIAKVVGMTAPGVRAALGRIQAGRPGRPAGTGPRRGK
jgi:hypothetical protein